MTLKELIEAWIDHKEEANFESTIPEVEDPSWWQGYSAAWEQAISDIKELLGGDIK